MDLLGTGQGDNTHSQQQQQGTAAGAAMNCAVWEKAGGGGAGAVPSDTMSRPSLISSLWSIQVQNEGSASDFPMAGCGSQQSLPEMLNQTAAASFHHCNGFTGMATGSDQQIPLDLVGGPMDHQPASAIVGGGFLPGTSLRPVKSLSDLHTLTAAQIAQTAVVMPCPSNHQQPTVAGLGEQSYLGFRRQTETGNYYNMLSRQQRDSQICEWLQKLNVRDGAAEASGSESPSQEFFQQQSQPHQRPPFQRADTTDQ